jgi:WD40 repeat protein
MLTPQPLSAPPCARADKAGGYRACVCCLADERCDQGTFQDFTGHLDVVTCLAFSPSGGMLASAAHTDIVCWEVCV